MAAKHFILHTLDIAVCRTRNRFGTICIVITLGLIWPGDSRPERSSPGYARQDVSSKSQTSSTTAEIDSLIAQLGSDDFRERQQSEKRLRQIGGPAITALKRARMAGDSEIRFRARRLLVEVVRKDYQKRLSEFLVSENPENSFGLNGWGEYSRIAGHDPYARRLFVGMQKTAIDMFLEWDASDSDFANKVELMAMFEENTQAHVRHVNAVAAAMLGQIRQHERVISIQPSQTSRPRAPSGDSIIKVGERLTQYETTKLVDTSGYQNCFGRLVTKWLEFVPDQSDGLTLKLRIIDAYDFPSFVTTALFALQSDQVRERDLATAIKIISRSGNESHLDQLEPLLANSENCETIRDFRNPDEAIQVQIRDVALAAMVRLSNQVASDYGFQVEGVATNDETTSYPKSWFATEQDREKAIQKWRKFRGSL